MTKRRRAKAARSSSTRFRFNRAQARCETCGRYRVVGEVCWSCNPPWPEPCICDVIVPLGVPAIGRHVHLDHALLERLTQLEYEAVDETILLPTEQWPLSDDDVVNFEKEHKVGIDEVAVAPGRFRPRRPAWREQPEYKAFLALHPALRTRARLGIDSIFAYFELTPSEADAWSLAAAGYTREATARWLGFKPGGIDQLLASVRSKLDARLKQSATKFKGVA